MPKLNPPTIRIDPDVIGMPESHKNAFLTAAASQKCIIIVRATGPTCRGLLEEGYDTKGYRIHGKSCDWGPMAGFVLRDPRLNKAGTAKEAYNRKQHTEALVKDEEGQGWKASTTPLMISRERVAWLTSKGHIRTKPVGSRLDGTAIHSSGIKFDYSLIEETPGLFSVYLDTRSLHNTFVQETGGDPVRFSTTYGPRYQSLLAMTNPPGHRLSAAASYKNAVTGDYDLFAVWPFVGSYNASAYGDDHRPLGTVRGSVGDEERKNVERLERKFTVGKQGTKLGNITPRIYMLCQVINSLVGRHVLWHSDEAARPFVDDVDLPVMAFTPRGNCFGIENISDFQTFISFCEKEGIAVSLSNAWAQNPTAQFPNRLGDSYNRLVPADGVRTIVPDWYNR